MIPTLLIVGLVSGRWWKIAVPVATVVWVWILIATGTGSGAGFAMGAAALAVVNLAVGAAAFLGLRALFRLARERRATNGAGLG